MTLLSISLTVLVAIIVNGMAQQSSERSASDSGNVYQSLSASCNEFTNTFHKELLSANEGNVVSSPLSVHMILSLLSHGAGSATLDEFTSGLCHRNAKSLNEGYRSLISLLNNVKDVKLHIANAMFVQDGFKILTEFLSIGADVYQSLISRVDFQKKAHAVEEINSWVKEKTNDKIKNLVTTGDFDEFTKLVLVNAIYFHGHWLHKFDAKDTELKVFHLTKTESKRVPTMFKKCKYNHGSVPSLAARFIEIPYMNKDITLTIILPNEVDGLQSLRNDFVWEKLAEAPRVKTEVELYLPKFKFESTINLEDILRKVGLNKMFQDHADFTRISDVPLKVSKVLHKAVIEINEEGTEAAAATAVHIRLRRMIDSPEEFTIDRPFMFAIEHKPSKLPLFLGNVVDVGSPLERDEL